MTLLMWKKCFHCRFAEYTDIDTAEKPPHPGTKTFWEFSAMLYKMIIKSMKFRICNVLLPHSSCYSTISRSDVCFFATAWCFFLYCETFPDSIVWWYVYLLNVISWYLIKKNHHETARLLCRKTVCQIQPVPLCTVIIRTNVIFQVSFWFWV